MEARFVATRYTVALATAALALLLRWILDPLLGHSTAFYVTVYMAVAFSVMVCGLGPSILCAVIATFGTLFLFVGPFRSLSTAWRQDIQGTIGCVLVCTVLIGLGEANRKKHVKLNQAQAELERRVEERTVQLSQALEKLESQVKIRAETEEHMRRLSLRLMMLQDEERRRIARNLHDAAGQTLAAIKMTAGQLQRAAAKMPDILKLVEDLTALTDEALQEIRTTSFLLHPPLLDEVGLASAVRWFVEGFSKRSQIRVDCEIDEKAERLPQNIELVLFRILQESLTNVHRHSRATSASIRLIHDDSGVKLEISDNGCGVAQDQLKHFDESPGNTGVGIAGMRERVRELGGQLVIQTSSAGTTITVALPRTHESFAAGAGLSSSSSAA